MYNVQTYRHEHTYINTTNIARESGLGIEVRPQTSKPAVEAVECRPPYSSTTVMSLSPIRDTTLLFMESLRLSNLCQTFSVISDDWFIPGDDTDTRDDDDTSNTRYYDVTNNT